MGLGLASPRPLAASSNARAMNSSSLWSRRRSRACASARAARLGEGFISGASRGIADLVEEGVNKRLRIEGHEVVSRFAGSDEAHRQSQFADDGNNDTAARGAIEFGEHDARDARCGGELARLREAVLA